MLHTQRKHCPYCGEPIDLVVDLSVPQQDYIEDCSVCCRPISVTVTTDDGQQAHITVRSEND